jgi:hypothetical protein
MTTNALPDPDRFAVTMPRPSVDGRESQSLSPSAFARFGVDGPVVGTASTLQIHAASHSTTVARPIRTTMLGVKRQMVSPFPHSG